MTDIEIQVRRRLDANHGKINQTRKKRGMAKRLRVGFSFVVATTLTFGCAASVPPLYTGTESEGEKKLATIQLTTKADQVKGCTSLGIVKQYWYPHSPPIKDFRGRVMTQEDFVRSEAVIKGGDTGVLVSSPDPW